MSAADLTRRKIGLTDNEKGIIFGVVLGTIISQFISAFQRSSTKSQEVTTRAIESRQPADRS